MSDIWAAPVRDLRCGKCGANWVDRDEDSIRCRKCSNILTTDTVAPRWGFTVVEGPQIEFDPKRFDHGRKAEVWRMQSNAMVEERLKARGERPSKRGETKKEQPETTARKKFRHPDCRIEGCTRRSPVDGLCYHRWCEQHPGEQPYPSIEERGKPCENSGLSPRDSTAGSTPAPAPIEPPRPAPAEIKNEGTEALRPLLICLACGEPIEVKKHSPQKGAHAQKVHGTKECRAIYAKMRDRARKEKREANAPTRPCPFCGDPIPRVQGKPRSTCRKPECIKRRIKAHDKKWYVETIKPERIEKSSAIDYERLAALVVEGLIRRMSTKQITFHFE